MSEQIPFSPDRAQVQVRPLKSQALFQTGASLRLQGPLEIGQGYQKAKVFKPTRLDDRFNHALLRYESQDADDTLIDITNAGMPVSFYHLNQYLNSEISDIGNQKDQYEKQLSPDESKKRRMQDAAIEAAGNYYIGVPDETSVIISVTELPDGTFQSVPGFTKTEGGKDKTQTFYFPNKPAVLDAIKQTEAFELNITALRTIQDDVIAMAFGSELESKSKEGVRNYLNQQKRRWELRDNAGKADKKRWSRLLRKKVEKQNEQVAFFDNLLKQVDAYKPSTQKPAKKVTRRTTEKPVKRTDTGIRREVKEVQLTNTDAAVRALLAELGSEYDTVQLRDLLPIIEAEEKDIKTHPLTDGDNMKYATLSMVVQAVNEVKEQRLQTITDGTPEDQVTALMDAPIPLFLTPEGQVTSIATDGLAMTVDKTTYEMYASALASASKALDKLGSIKQQIVALTSDDDTEEAGADASLNRRKTLFGEDEERRTNKKLIQEQERELLLHFVINLQRHWRGKSDVPIDEITKVQAVLSQLFSQIEEWDSEETKGAALRAQLAALDERIHPANAN